MVRQPQKKKLVRRSKMTNANMHPPLRAPPPKRKARVKKGKTKRAIKITGLDLLHSQTLLSTSPQGSSLILNTDFFLWRKYF